MSAALERRARQVRSRVAIRRWELRQQNHAKGVWYRLRRLLAGAEHVFIVSDEDFELLSADGRSEHPVGAELHPRRRVTSATLAEAVALASARELRVQLSAELLGARNWIAVPFSLGGAERDAGNGDD